MRRRKACSTFIGFTPRNLSFCRLISPAESDLRRRLFSLTFFLKLEEEEKREKGETTKRRKFVFPPSSSFCGVCDARSSVIEVGGFFFLGLLHQPLFTFIDGVNQPSNGFSPFFFAAAAAQRSFPMKRELWAPRWLRPSSKCFWEFRPISQIATTFSTEKKNYSCL